MSLEENELLIHPEHTSLPWPFSGIRVAQCLVFSVVFCGPCVCRRGYFIVCRRGYLIVCRRGYFIVCRLSVAISLFVVCPWLFHCLSSWLFHCLSSWLFHCLSSWLFHCLLSWLFHCLSNVDLRLWYLHTFLTCLRIMFIFRYN